MSFPKKINYLKMSTLLSYTNKAMLGTRNQVKEVKDLTADELRQITTILQPYYLDATELLARELEHNTHVYFVSAENTIQTFFMVSWNEDEVALKNYKLVYLGLSCTDIHATDKKLASSTYLHFSIDGYNYEQQHNTKLLLYGTTATPLILTTLPKVWDRVKPALDGSYDTEDKSLITMIRKHLRQDALSDEHPFVLKNYAKNTQYSAPEKARLAQIEDKFQIDTFKQLNICEQKGDRLLIMCKIPQLSKIAHLKKQIWGR